MLRHKYNYFAAFFLYYRYEYVNKSWILTSSLLAELDTIPLPDCKLEMWGPIGTILGWPAFKGSLWK